MNQRFVFLCVAAAAAVFSANLCAQTRTSIRDTLYNADGSRTAGQIEITWNGFLSADGKTIAAGKTTRRITDGVLDLALVPNAGAMPAGTSYAVTYLLASGLSYAETWVVPQSDTPVSLAAVRASIAPAPSVQVGQQQLSEGGGLQVLLDFYRAASASAARAGQCYWNTAANALYCSTGAGAWQSYAPGVVTSHAGTHASSGADPLAINASQITSGTLADSLLPATITGDKTFNGDIGVAGDIRAMAGTTHFEPETYSQPTFTPSHTKWDVGTDLDFTFVGDVLTYIPTVAGWGYIWQEQADMAVPPEPNKFYRFEWTVQNVTPGDFVCQIWARVFLAPIAVANGTSHADFIFPPDWYPAYVYCEGTTGAFEVVRVSLKKILGGNLTVDRNLYVGGNFSSPIINAIRYADQFPGADAGAKIAACITALPATGGTCDARGLEGPQTAAATITISKPVTLLLGFTSLTSSASPAFDFAAGAAGSAILGLGRVATILITSSPTADIIQINSAGGSYIQIHNLGFRSSVTRTAGAAIHPIAGEAIVSDVRIDKTYNGLQATNTTAGLMARDVTMSAGLAAGGNWNAGILLGGVGPGTVNSMQFNNVYINSDAPFADAMVDIQDGADGINFSQCQFVWGGFSTTAIWLRTTVGGRAPEWMKFSEVLVESGPTADGIVIDAGRHVEFTNSYIGGAKRGLVVAPGVIDVQWHGGIIYRNQEHGVYLAGHTRLNGVALGNNGLAANNTYDDIYVASGTTDFTIINVRTGDLDGLPANRVKYNLEIATGPSNRYIIAQNNFVGSATAAFSNGATGADRYEFGNFPSTLSNTVTGDIEVLNPATLGTESLKNGGDFGANWGVGGDFAVGGGAATYTDAIHFGTLTQLAANQNSAAVASRWYKFVYDITANTLTGGPVGTITTLYSLSGQALDLTVGASRVVYFRSAVAPTDFVVSITGTTSGAITFDNFSLKEVQGGNAIVNGKITGGGSGGIKVNSDNSTLFDGYIKAAQYIDNSFHTAMGAAYGGFGVSSGSMYQFGSGPADGPFDVAFYRNGAGVVEVNNGTAGTFRDLVLRKVKPAAYSTYTNCASSASPAVCGVAAAGAVVIAASATTVQVNTTAVTADSEIQLTRNDALGTRLTVTCNTQSTLVLGGPKVTAITPGGSFTVGVDVAPTTNPLCLTYVIFN